MSSKYKDELKNKSVLVVGLGKSGRAATEELLELGAEVSVQDRNSRDNLDDKFISLIENKKVREFYACEPEDMSAYDMMVVSPGVATDTDIVIRAKEAGVEVVGEMELAYRLSDGKFVAITGTNGKTTTTTLVGEIFEAAGLKSKVVGNIGIAAITEAGDADSDEWLIAETSSFQLETVSEFRPKISAILNLTPDHLNRHKTMEEYGRVKSQIFMNQDKNDYLVVNKDDEICFEMSHGAAATVVPFSRKEKLSFGAYPDGDDLYMAESDSKRILICSRDEVAILGDHNVENILASIAISYQAGIDPEVIGDAIRAFKGVEHRLEYCGVVDGIKYYNDSKATNVDATVIALRALEKDIVLIAGGDGKSQEFSELAENLLGRVKHLILFGRDAEQIGNAALKAGFSDVHYEKDMNDCVRKAAELAQEGDKVLLSPACASLDMYDNFEQRGKHFKNCVVELER